MENITFYVGMAEWVSLMGSIVGIMVWFEHKFEKLERRMDEKFDKHEQRFEKHEQRFYDILKEIRDAKFEGFKAAFYKYN